MVDDSGGAGWAGGWLGGVAAGAWGITATGEGTTSWEEVAVGFDGNGKPAASDASGACGRHAVNAARQILAIKILTIILSSV